MRTLIQDLKFGWRMLARNPGFTTIAVIILALGIGANTAIFSMFDAVVLKSLPVYRPDQLVLFADTPGEGTHYSSPPPAGKLDMISYPLYRYFRQHHPYFEDVCAFRNGLDELTVQEQAAGARAGSLIAAGKQVSGNYFSVLGVKAILGRTLTFADDREGAQPATVISYRYWSSQFDRNPSVIGRVLDVNGLPFTIVGVAPPGFFGERVESHPADLWLPLVFQPRVMKHASWLTDPNMYWLGVMGRLKPGASIQQAQASVNVQLRQALTAEMGSHLSINLRQNIQQCRIELSPGGRGLSNLRFNFSESLHLLMMVVLLVLLIACANVAGLLLARGMIRQREIAMRLALGAGRGRIIRQMLTESLLLAGLGGALGFLFAAWGVSGLKMLLSRATPLRVSPDWKVFAYTIGISAVVGIIFGIAPALRATKVELVPALKMGPATTRSGRHRFGLAKSLVAFQVACALPLVVSAGLLIQSLRKLADQNLGLSPEHVLLVAIAPRLAGYKPNQLNALYHRILDRVNALPGVRSASLASYSPMSGISTGTGITVQGYTPTTGEDMHVNINQVAPGYFRTEGIPLLLGRPITEQDTAASPQVAVVTEAFAREFFGSQNPIGRRFGMGSGKPKHSGDIEIVGVVKDVKFFSARGKPPQMVFLPLFQASGDLTYASNYANDLEVRAAGNPASVASEVRKALTEVDKNLPIAHVRTLPEQIHGWLNQPRMVSDLSSFFGALALLLAAIGLYGLLSYSVSRRTNEIGIRMALGAQRGDILRMVLKEALILAGIGVAAGIAISLGVTRLIASQLFGVTPYNPVILATGAVVVFFVALLAGHIPARRAMKVDPMVALRYE